MSWITVDKFPLDHNLTSLVVALRARQLPHRVIEAEGVQLLQVPDRRLLPQVEEQLVAWREGSLEPSAATPAPVTTGPSLSAQAWQFPLTVLLIVASIAGYAIIKFAPLRDLAPWLTFYALQPAGQGFYLLPLEQGIGAGQWWRLVTPAFLHFGEFHIIFNSLWMWELGRRLEFVQKRLGYFVFFLLAAAASNLTQHFWAGEASLFGGMSGVVYALVGYIAMAQRLAPQPALAVPGGLLIFMLAWLVLCLSGVVDMFISGSIANGAHVGGLVAGVLMGLLHGLWLKRKAVE